MTYRFPAGDSAAITKAKKRKAQRTMAEMHAATTGSQPWEGEHYLGQIDKAKKAGRPQSYIKALEDKLQRWRDRQAAAAKKAGV
jgi:hypothetical protein